MDQDAEREQLLERARLIQQAKEIQMRAMDPPGENEDWLDKGLQLGMKILDYPAGYLRSAAAAAQGLVKGAATGDTSGIPTSQDWMNTVKGNAPIMAEYNKRIGIPQGGSLSDVIPQAYANPGSKSPWYMPTKGGFLDPTARGAFSAAEDMALSPGLLIKGASALKGAPVQTAAELRAAEQAARESELAAAARKPPVKAVVAAGKAAKSLLMGTPLSDAAESSGAAIYRQPFAQADVAAMNEGKGMRAASQTAMDNGVYASSQSGLEAQMRQLANQKMDATSAIEDANRAKSAIPTQPWLQPTIDSALESEFADTVPRANAGNKVRTELEALAGRRPNMELDDLIQYKRDQQKLADAMGQYENKMVASDPTGNSAFEGPLRAQNASQATQAIENAFDAKTPGKGAEYHTLNSEWGNIRAGMPGINAGTKSEIMQAFIPKWSDAPLAGAGILAGTAMGHPVEYPLIAYGLSKLLGSTGFQTGGGLMLNRLGQSGVLDPAVREALLQRYHNGGAWQLLDEKHRRLR